MSNRRRAGTDPRLLLGLLILVALGLRAARLGFQPLWWDEGWSLYFATADVGTLLELTAIDIHPPLYYLLLRLWIQILGPCVLSVRLLSVLIGAATIPLVYATGRRLLGPMGGLVAACLLAFSPPAVYYSQEVRMYGLVTLLGLAALYFAVRWESANWSLGKPAIGLGYVLAATAALYTQYYAAFLLLALNLVILLRWFRSRRPFRAFAAWLAAQGLVAVLYLPWVWYAGEKLVTYVRFKIGVEGDLSLGLLAYIGRHLAFFNWGHAEGALAEWWWLGLLPLLILLLALISLSWLGARQERKQIRGVRNLDWLLTTVVVTLLCGFAANLLFPFNPPRSERLLLLALPAYLLLFAGALQILWQQRRFLAFLPLASFLALSLLSLFAFYTIPRYPEDDYRPVAGRIRALGLPGDTILCVHPWQVGYFHAYIPDDDARPTLFLTPREVIPRERQLWADDPAQMAADLDTLLAEHERLWFPDHRSMGRVLESQIESYLAQHAYPVLSEWHGENTVLSFFAAGEPTAQSVTAAFGEWLRLESAALSPDLLESGWGVVAVDLMWQASQPPPDDYTVGLRLVGPTGYVWAQRDAPPEGGLSDFAEMPADEPHLDRHGLLVPAGTPPGEYRVTLRVYRSQDVAVLPVTFEGGSGNEVTLGTVRVVRPGIPPPVEAMEYQMPLHLEFDGRLRLLGYNIGQGATVRPGEPVEVELFWQAQADPAEDFLPRLQLLDAGGMVAAELVEKPVAGTYPTAWWRAGELVRDPHTLPIPATVAPGSYKLALSLIRASDGAPLESRDGQTVVPLDLTVEVLDRDHNYEPTSPQQVQIARFGSSVELIGYDLSAPEAPSGSSLALTLHWHALATPDRNYHTFVHLLDTEDRIVAQHDGPPGSGEYPTLGWLPGEYLTDPHALQIPGNLPAGEYRLGVGLYDPTTWERLGDRVLLDTPVQVTGSQ